MPYRARTASRNVWQDVSFIDSTSSLKVIYMRIWRSSLQFNRDGGEKQNLHRSTGCVPKRPRDTCHGSVLAVPNIDLRHTIAESDRGALQKRSSPCPRGDDSRGNKTGLHSTSSGGEHLRSLHFIVVAFENPSSEDLECFMSAFSSICARESGAHTMPRANKNPTPSTIP